MSVYVPYHQHSYYSLLDSCTSPSQYVDMALRDKAPAISISEHGLPRNWPATKLMCDKNGIKYIFSCEVYLTESINEKIRDNYHCVILARNWDGVKELNNLLLTSTDKDHFYYTGRITFDQLINSSNNLITTSACLASALNKLPETNPYYEKLIKRFDFLEIQPHINSEEQKSFNKRLILLSRDFNKQLIAACDAHSINSYYAECRKVLLAAKHKSYGDEDEFDLTYKSREEMEDCFRAQGVVPMELVKKALDNTIEMSDMCENWELDTTIKYPILYGSEEEDSKRYEEMVYDKFEDKVKRGIIPEDRVDAYKKAIPEEIRVLKKQGMMGFMLAESEIIGWAKSNGIPFGPGRGSVGGSRVAFITDITDFDAEKYNTSFARFCNENRTSDPDIDSDCIESDRPIIFKHIEDMFGTDKTARVAAYGTLQTKAAIDEIGRYLAQKWSDSHQNEPTSNNPWSLSNMKVIKEKFESNPEDAAKKYKELAYYLKGLTGTVISQSIHPAGIVISPISLNDYGVFNKDGERCLVTDMDSTHAMRFLKFDMLVLSTVKIIKDTCIYAGIPYPKSIDINWDDQDVWNSMSKDTSMIFQMNSGYASTAFKQFKCKSIEDASLVTAAIRPSGASYREQMMARKVHKNPSSIIDDILKDNLGYLVFQEDVQKFLQDICGFSPSDADSIRRFIANKDQEKITNAMPKIIDGYCSKSDKQRNEAEEEAKEFIKVIEDSSFYMFNRSHALEYSMVSYLCGYFRYYYPFEWLTSFLNNAANDDDIRSGTEYANKVGIKITMPKWGVSRGDYYFDKEQNIISKGLSSIKYMGAAVADELYNLSQKEHYESFVDLLFDLSHDTSIDTRQIDILIKIDFFSEFGNQNELLRIYDMFLNTFNSGDAKQINKESLHGNPIEGIVKKYSNGLTKAGKESKNYILLDVKTIMRESEALIKQSSIEDLSETVKVRNFVETMGYLGYVSGEESDRRKLCITDVFPVCRRSDGKQFGMSVLTKSIGSGKESRFTVLQRLYDSCPIKKGDIIYCTNYERDGKFFKMTGYKKIE